MKLSNEWDTLTAESEDGLLQLVNLRLHLDEFRKSQKLRYGIDIIWTYKGDESGFPDNKDSAIMEEAEARLRKLVEKDKLGILTISSIGCNEKTWHFAVRHLATFQQRLNEALQPYPLLPLEIHVEEDCEWTEYCQLLQNLKQLE